MLLTTILNEINKDFVKSIFIAFDGIPTMAKIVEQRRRKYTKYILDEIRNRIYKKYESSIDTIRNEFENSRIIIDLNCKIDSNLIKSLININNVEIEISDKNEVGEGEKKIFEHISSNYNASSYLIVSPDSDVIILALLHQNLMKIKSIDSSFHIIKNIDSIEYINVDQIRLNLVDYIKNQIERRHKNLIKV
jgi:5'-3' exonuclease